MHRDVPRFGLGCLSMSLARYNNSLRQVSGRDPIGKVSRSGALNRPTHPSLILVFGTSVWLERCVLHP